MRPTTRNDAKTSSQNVSSKENMNGTDPERRALKLFVMRVISDLFGGRLI